MRTTLAVTTAILFALTAMAADAPLPRDDGYRGIWYYNQPSGDVYKYKYSGGFATYPQQHIPIAIYSREADKTFFVYGGRSKEKNELLHMVCTSTTRPARCRGRSSS